MDENANVNKIITTAVKEQILDVIINECNNSDNSQVTLANKLDVTQSRVSNLLNRKIDKFSIDMLLIFAFKLGIKIRVEVSK